jgi:hypothetical protein
MTPPIDDDASPVLRHVLYVGGRLHGEARDVEASVASAPATASWGAAGLVANVNGPAAWQIPKTTVDLVSGGTYRRRIIARYLNNGSKGWAIEIYVDMTVMDAQFPALFVDACAHQWFVVHGRDEPVPTNSHPGPSGLTLPGPLS